MESKSKLVKRAKKGDTEAFQLLIHEEKEKMYRMAYMYMKNEEDALEVFQESLYKALNSIRTLKQNDYFSTWLMRILINTAIAALKKKQKFVLMNNELYEQIGNVTYFQSEEHLDLLQAMDDIEEKYKTVLLLRFYQDYTVKQIATFLDCPEGTVKTNIRRGLEILRSKLKGVYFDDRQNSVVSGRNESYSCPD
ncbi:sigma-70 family RNA polymerase sigma factor [Lysinibacillus halotolerans]|uniref:Sigma-70 family RNA polymerase sigma factor n=1 Tax=Lysinibacillus halotolerans TaxID=1368476 RepID=A0A3M8H101_9BACI|nr:sigma-70 family RNA polymerase sigma factor [Lysinibacillus halotolerans]RNC96163.1 sigma-70 family RNA polymerase sigma factor [Lysinibacillus halotolerans]